MHTTHFRNVQRDIDAEFSPFVGGLGGTSLRSTFVFYLNGLFTIGVLGGLVGYVYGEKAAFMAAPFLAVIFVGGRLLHHFAKHSAFGNAAWRTATASDRVFGELLSPGRLVAIAGVATIVSVISVGALIFCEHRTREMEQHRIEVFGKLRRIVARYPEQQQAFLLAQSAAEPQSILNTKEFLRRSEALLEDAQKEREAQEQRITNLVITELNTRRMTELQLRSNSRDGLNRN